MNILLNGQSARPAGSFHQSFMQLLQAARLCRQRRVAVEVNRSIVPKSQHPQHGSFDEGDKVEIVHALGGG